MLMKIRIKYEEKSKDKSSTKIKGTIVIPKKNAEILFNKIDSIYKIFKDD